MTNREPQAFSCASYGDRIAALLDGELPADERGAVEQHLNACAECSTLLLEERTARTAVQSLRGSLSAPPELRARVQERLTRSERQTTLHRRLALFSGLAASLAIVAAVALLLVQAGSSKTSVLARAAGVHTTETLTLAPVSFRSADPRAVAAWAHQQTGHLIDVPSLAGSGYTLLGVRTEPSLAAGAVSLVYEGPGGRLTCAILPENAPLGSRNAGSGANSRFHTQEKDGETVAGWHESGTTYLLVGTLPPTGILQLARTAFAQ